MPLYKPRRPSCFNDLRKQSNGPLYRSISWSGCDCRRTFTVSKGYSMSLPTMPAILRERQLWVSKSPIVQPIYPNSTYRSCKILAVTTSSLPSQIVCFLLPQCPDYSVTWRVSCCLWCLPRASVAAVDNFVGVAKLNLRDPSDGFQRSTVEMLSSGHFAKNKIK